MATRTIRTIGDDVLTKVCKEVKEVTPKTKELIDDMFETMYDAMGVRRETGIQAQLLNEMLKVFEDMGRSEISAHDKLKEFVGHTPLQVLMGAILGIFCGVILYTFVF